jgi:hypothetical protein
LNKSIEFSAEDVVIEVLVQKCIDMLPSNSLPDTISPPNARKYLERWTNLYDDSDDAKAWAPISGIVRLSQPPASKESSTLEAGWAIFFSRVSSYNFMFHAC